MQSINRVILTGNLTRDPDMHSSGACRLRIAVNNRRKRDGQYEDKPGYYTVVAFGGLGQNCNQYLTKGRQIAVDGRLDWSEWEKDGQKREQVAILADTVQFLSGGEERQQQQRLDEPPF